MACDTVQLGQLHFDPSFVRKKHRLLQGQSNRLSLIIRQLIICTFTSKASLLQIDVLQLRPFGGPSIPHGVTSHTIILFKICLSQRN